MKVIIIEDEPIAIEVLKKTLMSLESVEVVGTYTNPDEALAAVQELQVDVAFIDIEMGTVSGLEIAQQLINEFDNIEVVFVTAYSHYAIDAFEMNAVDYILKPANEKRLKKTIERLQWKSAKGDRTLERDVQRSISISCFGNFQVFNPDSDPIHWRTRKAKELFAYLWLNSNNVVHRDTIIDEIYTDKTPDQAATYLHTTIYQIRGTLKRLGFMDSIRYYNEGYRLNVPYRSDLDELNRMLSQESLGEKQTEKVLTIYKDDFISEGYSWAIQNQQAYRDKVLNALKNFVLSQIETGEFTETLKKSLARMYEIDPYSEEVARCFIRYYGDQALKYDLDQFYKFFSANLMGEMGVKPSRAVSKLYEYYRVKLRLD